MFKPYWKKLLFTSFISLAASILMVMQPVLVQSIVNKIAVDEPVKWTVLALGGVAIAESIFSGFQYYMLSKIGESFVLGLRTSLIGRLLRIPIREHDRRSTGDLISRFSSDTSSIRVVVMAGLTPLVSALFMIVTASALMIRIDSTLFLVAVGVMSAAVLIVTQIGKLLRRLSFQSMTATGNLVASVERSLSAVRTIRASNASAQEEQRVSASAKSVYNYGIKLARLSALTQPVMILSTQGVFIVVLLLGSKRVTDGEITFGDLIGFILFLFLLTNPISIALQACKDCQSGFAAWKRVSEIMGIETEKERLSDGQKDTIQKYSTFNGNFGDERTAPSVTFDNVWFGYSPDNDVLRRVSFTVKSGTWTAIVGPTGSGKSTLLGLLERFYELNTGGIYVNGINITDLDHETLRSNLSYIEQDSPVLSGSFADNLSLGRPNITRPEMFEIVTEVRLNDLVERSPQGLDTEIGDGGILLSGGQRQRLVWARALLRGSLVLLMDEPTSSLDAATEEEMTKAVAARFAGRTRITVSHRLSTIIDADQIIVLDSGSVVGIGTHEELLREAPLYRDLAIRQLLVSEESLSRIT